MIKLKLKEIMNKKKLSITEVSNATGIARSTLTPIVNNPEKVQAMKFETIEKLCSYLDIELNELIEYKHNESKNEIINLLVSKDSKFGIIELKRSNTYNEKSGFISFSLEQYMESIIGTTGEIEGVDVTKGSYKCTLEIMTNEEIISLNSKFDDFEIKNQIQAMEQTEFKKMIEKMDRQELMDLTVKIVFAFMFSKLSKLHIELIDLSWSVGSRILYGEKNSFIFEIDYENERLNNLSRYEQANDIEFDNYNFDSIINK